MKRKKVNKKRNEEGLIFIVIILLLAFLSFLGLILFMLILTSTGSNTKVSNGGQNSKNGGNATANTNTNAEFKDEQSIGDLGTGGLVCVNLPGVKYPRTPALDRRVARIYLATKQELDAQGIPTVTANWGFRSNCQQVNVKSGGNLKAIPGTSPHEAARALDLNGILKRSDSSQIIAIFRTHGWTWLGLKDPPHFEIKGYQVGEPSHILWIQKIQADFKNGNPQGGCRGTECGD